MSTCVAASEADVSEMYPDDERWMREALTLAERARDSGEIPVGALVVQDAQIIGRGWNRSIGACDATAHAEIVAIREAGIRVGNYRLPGATLYVTLEPCAMCAGAITQARLERVVYGADDLRAGAVHSIFAIFDEARLNHRVPHRGGVLSEDSAALLRDFFRARRGAARARKNG